MNQAVAVRSNGRDRERGQAVVEVTLLAPWIFFLFIGALDLGFYSYALICAQNAARVAVAYTSSAPSMASNSTAACDAALGEMRSMANVRNLTSCDSLPLLVTAAAVTGADGAPASRVSVTYRTDQLIPIPGLLMGSLRVTRTAEMRVQ